MANICVKKWSLKNTKNGQYLCQKNGRPGLGRVNMGLTTKVEGARVWPDEEQHNTRKPQHHEACSYCYVINRCDGQTEPPVEYRGPNTAEHFLKALQEEERKIKTVLANPKAMRMTQE